MDKIECNVCKSIDFKEIKKGVYGNDNQNIYNCNICGHLFLAPLLSDDEEEQFYINEYPAFLLKRGDYKNVSPEDHFNKNEDEAKRRFQLIKHLLNKNISVLEIGSATGYFLYHIKDYVKDVCGIEPNDEHKDYANGVNIQTYTNFEDISEKKFDLIFLYYVFEHVKEPVEFINSIKNLLRDNNSKIVIEVPHASEALVSFYKSPGYNNFVWQRAHCSYFSVEVMKKIFDQLDLSSEFIPVQRYDISNHIHWLIEGKPGGAGKYNHIYSDELSNIYKKDMERAWLCDTILSIVGK